ncbi:MAG: thiamine pyrophosphate-dependent enzyme, partial [Candidatus Aminicenantaceae bacterium]
MIKTLNGDQAMAHAALSCGVKLATSYPGSPSSGAVEALIGLTEEQDLFVEWSSNERVALEMGIGASIAGRRALVCTKSVGLNVMVDPLMALNLTPINGGLVILLGDDPGGYGSQNDQDSRPLAVLLEMPLLEPASPTEGYAMMREAFRISEEYHTVVIIRETRSFTKQEEPVELGDAPRGNTGLGLRREPWRYVPVPLNAVEKHRDLHRRMEALSGWADRAPFNPAVGHGTRGVIAAGFAHRKLLDVVGENEPEQFRLLKLGNLCPLPAGTVGAFLKQCEEVLVLEEIEPFLETQIKALAYDIGFRGKIYGKQTGHTGREGELFRWQIQQALAGFLPDLLPAKDFSQRDEQTEKPQKANHCHGCGYDKILDALEKAARSLDQKPVLVGDPGCLVTVADRLDAKFAIGSAVGVADGLSKAGIEERAVALFGDSSFFHSTLPGICNAVHNQSNILMVVLDNQATATSGYQSNPGVNRDARGHEAPGLDMEVIVRACGVEHVITWGPSDPESSLVTHFRDALRTQEL